MFNVPEAAPATKPFLEVMSQAGCEYANYGKISDDTMNKLNIPMIPEEVYAEIVNGNAK